MVGKHQRLGKVNINDTTSDRVVTLKYLGVLVYQTLSWKDHLEYIGRKISRLGMLQQVCEALHVAKST